MGQLAPLALFVHRRPAHTQRVLAALQACPEFASSELYVFSDGAKSEGDEAAVREVREELRRLRHDRMTLIEAPRNQGLAKSIIGGVTSLCRTHGSVIVVEDDLLVEPLFLRFMNDALARYRNEPSVMHISGFVFGGGALNDGSRAVLLPYTHPWGWATWRRAWAEFDPDATGWREVVGDRALRRRFNLGGIEDYSGMLRQQVEGRSDSWWIRWYLTVFRLGAFGLFPPKSLVTSIGLDRSATHGWLTARLLEVAKAPGLDELPAWPDPRAGMDTASFARFRQAMRPGVRRILRLGGKVKRALADRADRQRPRTVAAGVQLPDRPA